MTSNAGGPSYAVRQLFARHLIGKGLELGRPASSVHGAAVRDRDAVRRPLDAGRGQGALPRAGRRRLHRRRLHRGHERREALDDRGREPGLRRRQPRARTRREPAGAAGRHAPRAAPRWHRADHAPGPAADLGLPADADDGRAPRRRVRARRPGGRRGAPRGVRAQRQCTTRARATSSRSTSPASRSARSTCTPGRRRTSSPPCTTPSATSAATSSSSSCCRPRSTRRTSSSATSCAARRRPCRTRPSPSGCSSRSSTWSSTAPPAAG